MIYMAGNGLKILVLEAGNIEQILAGRLFHTPDGTVLVAYTPDSVWLADKLQDTDGDAIEIARLIDESSKRPQKPTARPGHKMHLKKFKE